MVVEKEYMSLIVNADDIFFTQETCSFYMRCEPPVSVHDLTQSILEGCYDPLDTGFLLLDAWRAEIRQGRGRKTPKTTAFFTMDHRRLKYMKDANCRQIKVRCFSHPRFDEFINKGIKRIGLRSDIRITGYPRV